MKRRLIGEVVSNKMTGTIAVKVTRMKIHPLYKKRYQATQKILAHNPEVKLEIGEMVEIEETRPISKRKSWKFVRKVK